MEEAGRGARGIFLCRLPQRQADTTQKTQRGNDTIESKLKPRIERIQFGLYRVVTPLSFLRCISLATLFTMLYKVSRNQSTSSSDEDQQNAVETSRFTSSSDYIVRQTIIFCYYTFFCSNKLAWLLDMWVNTLYRQLGRMLVAVGDFIALR